jgi:hypothetical protein
MTKQEKMVRGHPNLAETELARLRWVNKLLSLYCWRISKRWEVFSH